MALMKVKRRTCLLRGLVLSMTTRGHFPPPFLPSRPSTYPLAAVMLRDGGAGFKRRTQLESKFGVLLRILFTEAAVAFFCCFSPFFSLRPVSPSTTQQDLLLHMPTMAARRCMVSAIGDLISSRVNGIFLDGHHESIGKRLAS